MQIDGEERDAHQEPRIEPYPECYFPRIPRYIDAAFRSSTTNEVYFFLIDKYVRVYYTPGQERQTDDKFLTDFPFASCGIRCAFDTEGNEAYIFSGNMGVCLDYANDKVLTGIERRIGDMFPILNDTVFQDGIIQVIQRKRTYLFKGENYALMNFITGSPDATLVHGVKPIIDGWSSFRDILPLDNMLCEYSTEEYDYSSDE
ncbi:hypothetical protein PHAVU_002G268600 [Phaseolus vulgaris]|uniref:Albumin-2 n=1 Tax=Phaseolus vulgaris TaxID=3885 RepID=V7CNM2_PHAVU|nr:hypothetical protein PHAVU_002G268600g [Phaseolus vulgaris]ESW31797.1 hypothetical protein PHAVU_002G268600g [Phaseolus vulgaris]